MTTTGTTDFNLNLSELIEEAFERAGAEVRSGYDFKTARRSLNLLTIELANRGINLWAIDSSIIPLIQGVNNYTLPVDTVDLLEHVIRTGTGQQQIDITISRISGSTYSSIPNKLATGKPIQVWINRLSGATTPSGVQYPNINVYPTPDSNNYSFVYWRLRRLQDAGNAINSQDIPFRFLNVIVAGLAYYLSMKIANTDPNRVVGLKAEYEQQLDLAMQEDREKASVRFVPRMF